MMSNETLSMMSDFIARYYASAGRDFSFRFPEEMGRALGPKAFRGENVFEYLAELLVDS